MQVVLLSSPFDRAVCLLAACNSVRITLSHNIGDAGVYSPVAGITPGISRCNRILSARQPRFSATHHCTRESPMLWPSVVKIVLTGRRPMAEPAHQERDRVTAVWLSGTIGSSRCLMLHAHAAHRAETLLKCFRFDPNRTYAVEGPLTASCARRASRATRCRAPDYQSTPNCVSPT